MFSTTNLSEFQKVTPDEAEGEIGGSVLSDLNGDGDFFPDIQDPYDFVYYFSEDRFEGDYGGPMQVVAVYRGGTEDQRVFSLNYYQFTLDIEDVELDDFPEDWLEVTDCV